ncbi:MiaB/RimO family radical SAM methylthiotransferase [Thermodesulfobium narugense]|uniref:MiaB/RimO family radical SAM methylthiotransferase n=1 Tax=Thermodesulfobium narugense TaxID=184064 RepID=UPI0002E74389|nr:MiaB/RimO family radical SAM methylthiotransferase [Thermodesulfobium narugense]
MNHEDPNLKVNELPKTFFVEVLGCQMNKYEGEVFTSLFLKHGLLPSNPEDAEVIVLLSCAVRENAENKALARIGKYLKYKKERKLKCFALGGCQAKIWGEKILERFPKIDVLFSPASLEDVETIVKHIIERSNYINLKESITNPDCIPVPENQYDFPSAYLPISCGCNQFCTYCAVPYGRGREKSRSLESILNEVSQRSKQGFKEIIYLGQNCDSYGKDIGSSLKELLELSAKKFPNLWFKCITSYPSMITKELLETIASYDNLCNYFSIPMQSGSDRILKLMNRKYSVEQYRNSINMIREIIPDAVITSDFIVGFPGETEKDFQDTINAIEEFKYDTVNIAIYSKRPFTPASKFEDNISYQEKAQRANILIKKAEEISLNFRKQYLNEVLDVLIRGEDKKKKGFISSRTKGHQIVIFKKRNKLDQGLKTKVYITSVLSHYMMGEEV